MGKKTKWLIFIFVCLLVGTVFGQAVERNWPIKKVSGALKKGIRITLPDYKKQDPLTAYIEAMSVEEKIGQLFMVALGTDENGEAMTRLTDGARTLIKEECVGGVILFKGNIVSAGQTEQLIEDLQEAATIPLFIGVDEEGGIVSRVGSNQAINERPFAAAYDIGKSGDSEAAYKEARRMGKLLKELGFNIDFAPVADLYNNPSNTVIGHRSFGSDANRVTPMVIDFAKGLSDEGIQPVVKHFPGHGNTEQDSHEGLAYVKKSLSQLEEEELVPFLKSTEAGVDAMMRGHLIVEEVDPLYPATLSKKWGDYIQAHFDAGNILMITDALNMGAIVNQYSTKEAVVLAFLAGNDLLLMPKDLKEAKKALMDAYEKGEITDERLNASVRKILSKKVERKILASA